MKKAIKKIRKAVGKKIHIMAGNVATLEGFNDLADWGADSIRCNIGGGSICTTRVQTGHGLPGLETILQCAQSDRDGYALGHKFRLQLAYVHLPGRESPSDGRRCSISGGLS